MRTRTRNTLLLALGVAVAGGLLTLPTAEAGSPAAIQLSPDQSRFWDGGFVASGAVHDSSTCGAAGPCFEWPLLVRGRGARLRVGLDTPSREDTFALDLVDPTGAVAASTSNGNQFNTEVFVEEPASGRWRVQVRPEDVSDASFRLRARLERTLPTGPAPEAAAPLLPNLQAVPPYELGFTAPVVPNGPYPPDRTNPPAAVAGHSLRSCTPDESAPVAAGGGGAVDCLRLTSGPMNVGEGPFDMRFTFTSDLTDGTADPVLLRGPIHQAVHKSDGSVEMREAGAYIFHTTHTHFHDENILTYELFRVDDADRGGLRKVGEGVKSGFCPADQLFGDWFSFDQMAPGDFGEGDSPTGNCFSPTDGLLGLTRGWGDVYRWQRPGQYVEFSGQGDGLYVVRATVDIEDHILETVEDDNAAYALVKVTGRSIDLLERGQGSSPWDRAKRVFAGDGPASYR